MIGIYADGAYNPILRQGGWGIVIVEDGQKKSFSGMVKNTTNNRMEITAAMEGILRTETGAEAVLYTDSQYLLGCVTRGWQRKANRDLFEKLDQVARERKINWKWIDQNNGNPFHKEAHSLATNLAGGTETSATQTIDKAREYQAELPVQVKSAGNAPPRDTLTQTLRIIDANLNRLGEGLRTLEEIARLVLNDSILTQQLKTMRHDLIREDYAFYQQLLQSRDSEGDVGVDMGVPGEEKERDLPMVLAANARRAQESLRVLEELAKIPEIAAKLDSDKFKQARFSLYTIEQKLLSGLTRREKQESISGLYVVIDTGLLGGRDPVDVAARVIRGGARTIKLMDKTTSKKALLPVALRLRELCAKNNVCFIVNEHIDITLAADADGVHLGPRHLPFAVARKLLPPYKILGCSVTTVEQAIEAEKDGADYIAVGSIFPSGSKEYTEVLGLERLREIKKATSVPLLAIGGITHKNVAEVVAAGADSVAVVSAQLGAGSLEEVLRQIINSVGLTK